MKDMKKRSMTVVILLILAVILGVILFDFLGNRPDRRGANPYALEIDEYFEVDEALIGYRETRNFSLGGFTATGICYHAGRLVLVGDSLLLVVGTDGTRELDFRIPPGPTCVLADNESYYVGYTNGVVKFDRTGNLLGNWGGLGDRAVVTSLAIKDDRVYVADAGNRRVVIFNTAGEMLGEFEGKSVTEAGHGFIIPSASFDLAVNSYGELWVVNPGKHAIENYSDDGRMRGFWQQSSMSIEGFSGCCNPAEITVMEDGSFVTSEKGVVRIKIYDQSGRLRTVVAPPALFKKEGQAPEICVDVDQRVYALDFDRNTIRVFEPGKDG
jgi:hypothetical protein